MSEPDKKWPLEMWFTRRPGKKAIESGWFKISHHLIKGQRTRFLGRGKWYKLSTTGAGNCERSIYRRGAYDASLRTGNDGAIAEIRIDYDGWVRLGDKSDQAKILVKIEQLGPWQTLRNYWRIIGTYPDTSVQITAYIGLVALIATAISIALTVWSAS